MSLASLVGSPIDGGTWLCPHTQAHSRLPRVSSQLLPL